ncbi:actin filament-associated protein 1 [Elysia marginata]|uniref:Actin filament-associated protein 1 n=1 Tax=Elysia marginata TaxID=1093978 RepID=A0AAV4HRH6_9GAST|nr:actin filament-associated protein 1 [Elysia marginata]
MHGILRSGGCEKNSVPIADNLLLRNAPCEMKETDGGAGAELLPGIEEFLTETLGQEHLSLAAEERRQFFLERLDIIKLPPSLPPREGRKLSPELLKETEQTSGVPSLLSSPGVGAVVCPDFAAAQRQIARSQAGQQGAASGSAVVIVGSIAVAVVVVVVVVVVAAVVEVVVVVVVVLVVVVLVVVAAVVEVVVVVDVDDDDDDGMKVYDDIDLPEW